MERKELYLKVTEWFSANMERAESELHYDSPFHLLIAVILSAQCTDKRVNMHTPQIFARFPSPKELAEASFDEVYQLIKSISFPNNKAKHLIGMAGKLISDFGGEVPSEPAQLETLPGVGRKTANVIASVIYDKPVIAVDTHVFRVSRRIGLSDGSNVEAVEIAERYRATIQYDEQAQTPFFYYTAEDGKAHVVWFEDARSILAKLRLADSMHLGGLGYWNLLRPFPQNWALLSQVLPDGPGKQG